MKAHLFNMAAGGSLCFVTLCNSQALQNFQLRPFVAFIATVVTEVFQEYTFLSHHQGQTCLLQRR